MTATFDRFGTRAVPVVALRLDDRLVRAAVAWSLHPGMASEEAADRIVVLAGGNRSAVEHAIRRVRASTTAGSRRTRDGADTASGRAAAVLRLALARGTWSW
jgi:hypothetical protein